jgi:hypothetical protein
MMGIKVKRNWIRTLPVVAGLSACFLLFQNFSLDNEYRDIRTIAPVGAPAEPPSPYFPEHIGATSLNGLGQEILKHNFGDEMRRFENNFEDWSGFEVGRGPASAGPTAAAAEDHGYRLRTGHLGQDKFGFRLQSSVNVKCEYSAFKNELQVSVDKAIGRNANLSLKHNTDDHNSTVNFSYAW